MFFKTSTIAALIAVVGQSMAGQSPITTYGTTITFPEVNYGGKPAIILNPVQGSTGLCQIYKSIDTGAKYPAIRSYVAVNTTCIIFPTSDCSGQASTSFISSGNKPNVNLNVGSLYCIYSST